MTNIQKDVKGSNNVEFDYIFHNIWPQSSIDYSYWPANPPDYRYRSNETFKINHQFLRSNETFKTIINFSDLPKPSKSIIDFSDLTFDFDFREVNEEYIREVKKLSDKILGWLSKGLGLRREALMEEGLGSESAVYMMKVINYPPCPLPEQILGMGAHTDVNGLTLIVPNEISGLQVFKDDHWFDYEYNPSAIAILLGDSILRMSNGRYKSVIHRTIVNKEKKRMSWVVFLKSSYDTIIKPFPELIDGDQNPPKFDSITFRDLKHHWINSFRVN